MPMPNSKEKLIKYSGYYRCTDNIGNFKIRIRLKQVDPDNTDGTEREEWNTQEFSWQEKHFSKFERDFYRDINNCLTDLENIYHEKIADAEVLEQNTIFFTYVNQDGYSSEQESFRNEVTHLQKMVENMEVNIENGNTAPNEFDYKESMLSCLEINVILHDSEKMYIMADLGEYVEDIWIKNEQVLCILKFDRIRKVLSVYPDFTTTKPYSLRIHNETVRDVYYFIENCYLDFREDDELRQKECELMKQILDHKRSLTKEIVGDKFFSPPKNKLFVYIFFEILSGKDFEYSDVYIQYWIDLPEHWSCENVKSLRGVTQTCHGLNEDGLAHFAHEFDVALEYDIQDLQENGIPKTPYVYFEVISKATWNRYRTEGLTYKNLPISSPGSYSYKLSCFRFDTRGPSGRLKRFFIGDSFNYRDVKWLGLPQQNQGAIFNKFGVNTIGTGQLNIRMNVIHQSPAFLQEFKEGDRKEKLIYEKLNASSLIKSVNQVLHAFRNARRTMIEARKNV